MCVYVVQLLFKFEINLSLIKKTKKKEYHRNCSLTKASLAAKLAKKAVKKAEKNESEEDDQSPNHSRRLRRRMNVCFSLKLFYNSDLKVCVDNKQEYNRFRVRV